MEQEKAIQLFEKKYMTVFQNLSDLKKEQDRLADIEKKAKAEIEKAMYDYGITSVKNDLITITRVEASESRSIDLTELSKKEPKLYGELLEDYPKVSTKKAYVRFTVAK